MTDVAEPMSTLVVDDVQLTVGDRWKSGAGVVQVVALRVHPHGPFVEWRRADDAQSYGAMPAADFVARHELVPT